MEKARMLGTDGAVAGGTEGGRSFDWSSAGHSCLHGAGRPGGWQRKVDPGPGAYRKRPMRRRFTGEYKLRTLQEADRLAKMSTQRAAMLRARVSTRRT